MNHVWRRLSAFWIKDKLCECVLCEIRAWKSEIRKGGLGKCQRKGFGDDES